MPSFVTSCPKSSLDMTFGFLFVQISPCRLQAREYVNLYPSNIIMIWNVASSWRMQDKSLKGVFSYSLFQNVLWYLSRRQENMWMCIPKILSRSEMLLHPRECKTNLWNPFFPTLYCRMFSAIFQEKYVFCPQLKSVAIQTNCITYYVTLKCESISIRFFLLLQNARRWWPSQQGNVLTLNCSTWLSVFQ